MDVIKTKGAPATRVPYSQAVSAGGLLYCSGQLGILPGEKSVVDGGIDPEVRQAIANLRAVLRAGDSRISQVVKLTISLVDIDEFHDMNGVVLEAFRAHRPAFEVVQVAKLPNKARVQIGAIAVVE